MLPFTGSIALVIGAVVGLGAGFMFLYKKSETFRKGVGWLIDKFKELWGWIKKFTGIGAVLDFGKNVYNKAKNFLVLEIKINQKMLLRQSMKKIKRRLQIQLKLKLKILIIQKEKVLIQIIYYLEMVIKGTLTMINISTTDII